MSSNRVSAECYLQNYLNQEIRREIRDYEEHWTVMHLGLPEAQRGALLKEIGQELARLTDQYKEDYSFCANTSEDLRGYVANAMERVHELCLGIFERHHRNYAESKLVQSQFSSTRQAISNSSIDFSPVTGAVIGASVGGVGAALVEGGVAAQTTKQVGQQIGKVVRALEQVSAKNATVTRLTGHSQHARAILDSYLSSRPGIEAKLMRGTATGMELAERKQIATSAVNAAKEAATAQHAAYKHEAAKLGQLLQNPKPINKIVTRIALPTISAALGTFAVVAEIFAPADAE